MGAYARAFLTGLTDPRGFLAGAGIGLVGVVAYGLVVSWIS